MSRHCPKVLGIQQRKRQTPSPHRAYVLNDASVDVHLCLNQTPGRLTHANFPGADIEPDIEYLLDRV